MDIKSITSANFVRILTTLLVLGKSLANAESLFKVYGYSAHLLLTWIWGCNGVLQG
jgi:hypothetical protein